MRRTIIWGLAVLLIGGMTSGGRSVAAGRDSLLRRQANPSANATTEPVVTPVTGSSWLNRKGIKYRDTSLGRGAGRYGPGPQEPAPERRPLALPRERSVQLTGADLYRLNCQACHRAEGTGATPEVRSLLPAVEGSSFEAMRQRLRAEGKAGAGTEARKAAAQARSDLYTRIQHGGQKMPPREHLQESDIDMLYAYLTELAGTPDARPLAAKTVSWERLGENVVKGTCHICHDAVGTSQAQPSPLNRDIPSFTTLLARKNVVDFITKATSGAPTTTGDLPFHTQGRMPVFYYLKDHEVAAAYLFLNTFPPQATR
jgi:mono/diheme cytochrome c family protein